MIINAKLELISYFEQTSEIALNIDFCYNLYS